ncbi:MAG: hypothetical protein ACE5Z5_12805 [Candidatus Bathyarchaeia archaeon]
MEKIDVWWEGEEGYKGAWKTYGKFEIDYGPAEPSVVERETVESLEWAKLHFTRLTEAFKGFRDDFGDYRKEFKGFRDEFSECRDEFRGFAESTDQNLKTLEERYGEISARLTRVLETLQRESMETRKELTRAVDALSELVGQFVRRQK